jgi:2-polyprenyl-3-methyl-5-hydroxy-6-metoxy-1,4-benzoquinol methylase
MSATTTQWNNASGDWQGCTEGNSYQATLYSYLGSLILPASHVLDVGCGMGALSQSLPADCHYIGVEPSADACKEANSRGLLCAHGTAEDYRPTGTFDAIIFNEVLYYMGDPVTVLEKYAMYLKPGGRLIVSIWQKRESWFTRGRTIGWDFLPASNKHCSRIVEAAIKENRWTVLSRELIRRDAKAIPWQVTVIKL